MKFEDWQRINATHAKQFGIEMPKWVLPAAQYHAPESLVELEQTGPANALLAVYCLYSDGHRHELLWDRKASAWVVYSVIGSSLFCCCSLFKPRGVHQRIPLSNARVLSLRHQFAR